jgi:hypothetical protein
MAVAVLRLAGTGVLGVRKTVVIGVGRIGRGRGLLRRIRDTTRRRGQLLGRARLQIRLGQVLGCARRLTLLELDARELDVGARQRELTRRTRITAAR